MAGPELLRGKLFDEIGFNSIKGELFRYLVLTDARITKDAANRKRGIEKLEKNIAKGKLTKQHINNRGYKFLVASYQFPLPWLVSVKIKKAPARVS